jgi:hypothetical protein
MNKAVMNAHMLSFVSFSFPLHKYVAMKIATSHNKCMFKF